MSIVIAVATLSRVIVKSDGMVLKRDTGEIQSRDYEKINRINENCIIGYTGDKEYCEHLINEYKRLVLKSGIDIHNVSVTEVLDDLNKLSKLINDNNNSNFSLLIAGKENEKIILKGFSSKDGYKIQDSSPDKKDIMKFLTLGSDIQNNAKCFKEFYDVNRSIESTMNEYIRYISTIDSSVNDIIFTKKIKLNT